MATNSTNSAAGDGKLLFNGEMLKLLLGQSELQLSGLSTLFHQNL